MTRTTKLLAPVFVAALGAIALVGSLAIAEPAKDVKPAAAAAPGDKPEMKLPPGWTEEDMKNMIAAGTPGKMQEFLSKDAGTWTGKNTMWMGPGVEPITADSTAVVTPLMGGRYTKVEVKGEMPGMGPFEGLGIYAYDNVAKKFQCTWIDNMSTGMAQGTAELSPDGKVWTVNYSYTCPITKKATTMREVHTRTGENTKTLEMWGVEPKSGKEFKMMKIEMTKKA
jgi:hypothetical protein